MIPQIHDISSQTEVRLGTPAVLACLATGFPIPSISWSKDGEEVNIYSDSSLNSRIDVFEFAANSMVPTGSNSSDFQSSGYMGSGSIVSLLMMHTNFTVDQVLQLGDFGVVGLLSFEVTVRDDGAEYRCIAFNSFPETTTAKAVSSSIPLVILGELMEYNIVCLCTSQATYFPCEMYNHIFRHTERPDPPLSVTAFDYGARWVALRWAPSFDGNRPVTNVSLYVRSVDVSSIFSAISSLSVNNLMKSEGNFMYNISGGDKILPYTNYSFTVVSCSEIGCSDQSDPSPVIRTNQDGMSVLFFTHICM